MAANVTFYPIGYNPQAYKTIFRDAELWRSILNSFIVSFGGCALSLIALSVAAYPLAFGKFYGKKLYSVIIMFTMWFQGGIVPLFLTRSTAEGGLGMSDVDFGFIYGTLGVIGLLLGGIVGGWAVSKWGLKKCLWPLVLCITLPDIVYVYLSYYPTDNLWLIGSCVCIEQIGYGLGFAAYTLYLVTFYRGEHSTTVFSICTAGQYLGGVMIPGMVSGLISENIGYQSFFWIVMAFCLVTFTVTAFVKIIDHKE